jgi:hypothetical protein
MFSMYYHSRLCSQVAIYASEAYWNIACFVTVHQPLTEFFPLRWRHGLCFIPAIKMTCLYQASIIVTTQESFFGNLTKNKRGKDRQRRQKGWSVTFFQNHHCGQKNLNKEDTK